MEKRFNELEAYNRFAQYYDLLMSDVDYKQWSEYIHNLLLRFHLRDYPVRTILDCACGTGSVSVPLAKLGYSVTGMDLSEEMLGIASEKMRKNGQKCMFVRGDMRKISIHKNVDAVISCCDGVNYLKEITDFEKFCDSTYNTLKENGLFLFDISSEHKLKNVLGGNTYGEDREECTYLWQNYYCEEKKRLEMYLHFFVKNCNGSYDRFDETHIQRAYSAEEVLQVLKRNNFEVLAVYDAFTLNPYRKDSERIQFISRRK